MDNVEALLNAASVDGVFIDTDGNKLTIETPKSKHFWKKRLQPYKQEIVDYLSGCSTEIDAEESKPAKGRHDEYVLTSTATDKLHGLLGRLRRGEGDVLFSGGEVFEGFECGPGLLTVLAAGPGAGKTTLAMQYGFASLRNHLDLRLMVANAETGFDMLLKRELARLSGVSANAIRFADLTNEQLATVEQVAADLAPLLARVDVFEPPYSLARIKQLETVSPGLLILDYLQKFSPADKEPRVGVTLVASALRNLCHQEWAVLALSSTSRRQGKGGSTHDSQTLNMASLKESGEIEFNADAVYLIRDRGMSNASQPKVHTTDLDLCKNRNGSKRKSQLLFNKTKFEFLLSEQETLTEFEEFADADCDPFGGVA